MKFARLVLGALLVLFPVAAHSQIGLGQNAAPAASYANIPSAYQPFSGSALPPSVDLSASFPPPGDQGAQQSCVGWAVAYGMKTFQENVERNWGVTDPNHVFSPSFIYNQINNGQDKGSNFGDAFRVLTTQGAASLVAMPYASSPFAPIPNAAQQAAGPFRIDTFRTVNFRDVAGLKAQLNAGFPIIFAAHVDQGFVNLHGSQPYTYPVGAYLGRHAMVAIGYSDAKQAFKVLNSWGTGWGDGGYGWIGYGQFQQMATEAYIVFDQKGYDVANDPANIPADVWTPPPLPSQQSSLSVTNVIQNFMVPGEGPGMRIEG